MFIYISGYLFQFLLKNNKYSTWKNLLEKKGIRILTPYFAFGLFFMATTGNFHPLRLFLGTYWHLWFLPMLFWCFVVGYGVYKLKLSKWLEGVLLLLSYCGVFLPMIFPRWMGINYISDSFYWFYLGMLMYKYREGISRFLIKYKLHLLLLLISIMLICSFPVEYGDGNTWYSCLSVTAFVVSFSFLLKEVDWNKYRITSFVVDFSTYSFGIYIWHNWVALMLISKTSKNLFGLPELAANHLILFPLCFSLLTLAISWGISWCMMKTKVGRFLIG